MAALRAGARSVVDYLLESHTTCRSGILRLEEGRIRKQLVLRQGLIAFAESNVPGEHLAVSLVKLGRLQRGDLAKVATQMKQGSSSEDAILATTSLDRPMVEDAARRLVVTITSSMFKSPGDALRFYSHEGPLHRGMDLRLPVPPVIMESVRHAVAHRHVPPCFEVLRGMVQAEAEPGEERMALPLDGAEAWVFSALNQPVSCAQIASKLPATGASPEELVRRLLMLGLVRMESPADSKAEDDAEVAKGIEQDVADLMDRFETADHYGILGVSRDADYEQIREGYHALARKYHPDRFQSAGEGLRKQVDQLFTMVTGAYAVLSDAGRRASYDAELEEQAVSGESKRDLRKHSESENKAMADSLYRAGGAAFSKGDFERAIVHFKECVWLQPTAAKYLFALGRAQMEVPRHRKEAEKNLLEAIQLHPMHAPSHIALARLYVAVNLARRAESRLVELLRWDPGNRDARTLLAEIQGKS